MNHLHINMYLVYKRIHDTYVPRYILAYIYIYNFSIHSPHMSPSSLHPISCFHILCTEISTYIRYMNIMYLHFPSTFIMFFHSNPISLVCQILFHILLSYMLCIMYVIMCIRCTLLYSTYL